MSEARRRWKHKRLHPWTSGRMVVPVAEVGGVTQPPGFERANEF